MEDKFQWYKPGFLPALLLLIGTIVLSFSMPAAEGESIEGIKLMIIPHAALLAIFFLMDEGLLGLGRWNFAAPLAALTGCNQFCNILNYYWYKTFGSALQLPVPFPAWMLTAMLVAALAAFALNYFLRRPVPTESQTPPLLPETMEMSSWVYWEHVEAKWMDGIIALAVLLMTFYCFRTQDVIGISLSLFVGLLVLFSVGGFRYSISRERIRLRWGWARIPLLNLKMSDITEVDVMKSGVFRHFGGFGIRYSFAKGWGFVLSNKAICLKTRKGKRYAFSARNLDMAAKVIEAARRAAREPIDAAAQISQTGTGVHAAETTAKPWRRLIPILSSAGIVPIVLIIIYMGYKEPTVVFDSNAFKLKGLYGVNIPLTEIADAELITLRDIPVTVARTNGISINKVHRGNYRTTANDKISLSLNSGSNPVIRIVDRQGNAYYINRKNPDETKWIFNKLTEK